MSEREILIRLEGAGEKACEDCCDLTGEERGDTCSLWYKPLDTSSGKALRCAPCLAAERAAADLQEAAKYKARWERLRHIVNGDPWILSAMDRLEQEG